MEIPQKLNQVGLADCSEDQLEALDCIVSWYKSNKSQEMRMGGLAGVGKTTIIKLVGQALIRDECFGVRIAYAAYTGKACRVLRKKEVPASTIHSLIYNTQHIIDEETKIVEYIHILKEGLDVDLIIVDEASMVGLEIYGDLMSFGVPVLFVGDHGQLPPIDDSFNLMDEARLHLKLEKIHRQAEQSRIIRASMAVRNGYRIADQVNSDFSKIPRSRFSVSEYFKFKQIITGKNVTRVFLNNLYRKNIPAQSEWPEFGDKLIFLKNDKDNDIINGQQVVVMSSVRREDGNFDIEYVDMDDEGHQQRKIAISHKCINTAEPLNKLRITRDDFKEKLVWSTFGYAITVHKSQGSEWESVLLYDDGFGSFDQEFRRRWLYTAITRASEQFTWVY